jgi:O-acetyl-ADP-ribose deacetylase (regulator of RNase III)
MSGGLLAKKQISNLVIINYNQDLFNSDAQTLVNTVNCVGIMGKGIAKEFRTRYPRMYEDYRLRCDKKELKIGEPYVWKDNNRWVLNFPTKLHYNDLSQLDWIEDGLKYFIEHYKDWGITSIAFPALGCNNGKLEWKDVLPLMKKQLGKIKDINIEIYPPYSHTDKNNKLNTNMNYVSDSNKKTLKVTKLNDLKFIAADKLKKPKI